MFNLGSTFLCFNTIDTIMQTALGTKCPLSCQQVLFWTSSTWMGIELSNCDVRSNRCATVKACT